MTNGLALLVTFSLFLGIYVLFYFWRMPPWRVNSLPIIVRMKYIVNTPSKLGTFGTLDAYYN